MSIVRIPRRIKKFDFDGATFGLRQPKVHEQAEITRLTSAFTRSIKKDVKQDKLDGINELVPANGDQTLMAETQVYVAQTLVVDPDTGASLFGPGGEDINDVPAEFVGIAWFCYAGLTRPPILADLVVKALQGSHTTEEIYTKALVTQDSIDDLIKDLPAEEQRDIREELTRLSEQKVEKDESPLDSNSTPTPDATTSDSAVES